MKDDETSGLIEFPCDFPIKVIGDLTEAFAEELLVIARKHHPEITEDAITTKVSKAGNYLSVTITVHTESQEALDALYADFVKHPSTKMVL